MAQTSVGSEPCTVHPANTRYILAFYLTDLSRQTQEPQRLPVAHIGNAGDLAARDPKHARPCTGLRAGRFSAGVPTRVIRLAHRDAKELEYD